MSLTRARSSSRTPWFSGFDFAHHLGAFGHGEAGCADVTVHRSGSTQIDFFQGAHVARDRAADSDGSREQVGLDGRARSDGELVVADFECTRALPCLVADRRAPVALVVSIPR